MLLVSERPCDKFRLVSVLVQSGAKLTNLILLAPGSQEIWWKEGRSDKETCRLLSSSSCSADQVVMLSSDVMAGPFSALLSYILTEICEKGTAAHSVGDVPSRGSLHMSSSSILQMCIRKLDQLHLGFTMVHHASCLLQQHVVRVGHVVAMKCRLFAMKYVRETEAAVPYVPWMLAMHVVLVDAKCHER